MYVNSAQVLASVLKTMCEEHPSVDITWSPGSPASPVDDYGTSPALTLTPAGGQRAVFYWHNGPKLLAEALKIELPTRFRSLVAHLKNGEVVAFNIQPS